MLEQTPPAIFSLPPAEDAPLLTIVIHSHHEIDVALEDLLHLALPKAEKLEVRRIAFLLKADILIALGVLPSYTRILFEQVNSIRNKFAHNPYYQLHLKEVLAAKNAVKGALPNLTCEDFNAAEAPVQVFYWLALSTWLTVEHHQNSNIRKMAESAAVNEMFQDALQKIPPERRTPPRSPAYESRVQEIINQIQLCHKKA